MHFIQQIPEPALGCVYSTMRAAIFSEQAMVSLQRTAHRNRSILVVSSARTTTSHPASHPDTETEPTPCKNGDAIVCRRSSTIVPNPKSLKTGAKFNERALSTSDSFPQ
ncbi:hypothetical protein Ac2012v2_004738 [Leucoagaricus gongylophorus]